MTNLEDFRISAQQYGLIDTEHKIAAWSRALAEPEGDERTQAENVTLRVLLDLATSDPRQFFEADGNNDIFANVLARALGNSYQSAEYSTEYFAALSALTFAGAGNFASSSVFARLARKNSDSKPVERWLMGFLAELRNGVNRTDDTPSYFREYARRIDKSLQSGNSKDFDDAYQIFLETYSTYSDSIDSADRYLLLLWSHVHERLKDLSAARVLNNIDFNNKFVTEFVANTSPLLFPSQVQALETGLITAQRKNIIISFPTSAGKSLLGEIALIASLEWQPFDRWLAVYLAPYRALADQIYDRMRPRLKKIGYNCIMRRGNYLSDISSLTIGSPTVLVATPEAFDGMLRQNPRLYSGLSAAVFDEFHLIEQQSRGLRYEGIIGRFLDGAAGTNWPKIIGLSAVIKDVEKIKDWLKLDEESFIQSSWKPTGRRVAVTHPNGQIDYYTIGEQHITPEIPDWRGKLEKPHRVEHFPTRPSKRQHYQEFNSQKRTAQNNLRENISFVTHDQYLRFKEPVLVLSNSRAETKRIAVSLTGRFERLKNPTNVTTFARQLIQRYPYLRTLHQGLLHGIAYHNASLPDWVRRQLENLMTNRELRVVVATTTLAEGVDLPFRVVVMANWRLWRFGSYQPMPPLLFQNIAGRCGRAGRFSEGDTIIVDYPYESEDFNNRRQQYINLYVNPSQYGLKSSVASALETGDIVSVSDTDAVLESQYLAYLATQEGQENTEIRFGQALFASQFDTASNHVTNLTEDFVDQMLAKDDFQILQRNSPLRLTEFGRTVLQTGLSPWSGYALAEFITSFELENEPSTGKRIRKKYGIIWQPILAKMWKNVKVTDEQPNWIKELEDYTVSGHIKKRGKPVTEKNFIDVVSMWVSGIPIEIIAYLTLRKKEFKEDVERWLEEETDEVGEKFENWIEEVAILCKNYLGEQWAWVCRGAAVIAENLDNNELSDNLKEMSDRLTYGVSSQESIRFLQGDCPIDRAKVDWIINRYKSRPFHSGFEITDFNNWLNNSQQQLVDQQISTFQRIRISEQDIIDFTNFVARIAGRLDDKG